MQGRWFVIYITLKLERGIPKLGVMPLRLWKPKGGRGIQSSTANTLTKAVKQQSMKRIYARNLRRLGMSVPCKHIKRFIYFIFLSTLFHAQVGHGAVYHISTKGQDTNHGTLDSPWASPNHALNCGDIILASPGTYAASNFASGKWGTVTCGSGNRVAWLICSIFDACKISAGTSYGMYVDKSYWGVQGWETTTDAGGAGCFSAAPAAGAAAGIHHIIFANDIANGCGAGGFGAFSVGTFGVDYIAIVGSIAYNAAQNSLYCYSGISIYQPLASDSAAGTHIYVAGNFSYSNAQPAVCAGVTAPGADGAIFDSFDGCAGTSCGAGSLGTIYTQQAVMAFNFFAGNGGRCYEYQTSTKNAAFFPTILRYNNTCYGDLLDTHMNTNLCSEATVNIGYGITDFKNIVDNTVATACTGHTAYAMFAYDANSANVSIAGNLFFSAGSATGSFNDDGNTFSYGTNATVANPGFTAPAVPGAPSCGSASSVPKCMSTVISNFASTAAPTYGYQTALTKNGSDPYFPKWLCSAGLPHGLVTLSC